MPTTDENISGPDVPNGIRIEAVISGESESAVRPGNQNQLIQSKLEFNSYDSHSNDSNGCDHSNGWE